MRLISQTEQSGGYWLITMQLETDQPLPFGYQLRLPNQKPLALFQQRENQAQFLSSAPLDETADTLLVTQVTDNQTTPAWQILSAQITTAMQGSKPILLLAKDLNMANLFHFAQLNAQQHDLIAILEAADAFPFVVKPAKFLFEDFPAEAIGACPLLEDWKVPNRLCSTGNLMGCYDGTVEEALQHWKSETDWSIIDFRTLNESPTNP